MLTISAFLERYLHVELIPTRKGFDCCCPIHDENTPSFKITVHANGSEVAHCYGACPRGHNHFFDVVGVLRHLPPERGGFGDIADQTEAFRRAHRKAERLRLVKRGELRSNSSAASAPHKTVMPNADQRAAMTIFFEYARRMLTTPDGGPGLDYLHTERGIQGPFLRLLASSIGYMPAEKKHYHAVMTKLRAVFGERAMPLAEEIGFVNFRHTPNIINRLVFAVYHEQEVVWYQTRSCYAAGPKKTRFYNPPAFSKQFYTPLAPDLSVLAGTWLTEGPTDTLANASQGLFAVGLMSANNLPTVEQLHSWPHPVHLHTDNEAEGKAGAMSRQQLIALCAAGRIPYVLPEYPEAVKDDASYLKLVGPDHYFQIQQEESQRWHRQQNAHSVGQQQMIPLLVASQ